MSAVCFADASKRGTWYDPFMYPSALVVESLWTLSRYALNHETKTARFLDTFSREGMHSSATGVCATALREGNGLRLMSFPWNTTAVYAIEDPTAAVGNSASAHCEKADAPTAGDSPSATFVTDWIERGNWTESGLHPQRAIGLVTLSDGQTLSVFHFHVAATCQDAKLKGYAVVPTIEADRRCDWRYLVDLKAVQS